MEWNGRDRGRGRKGEEEEEELSKNQRKNRDFCNKKKAEQQIGKMNDEKRQTEKSIGKVTNGMEIGIGQSVDRGDKPINRPKSDQGEV
ncbi:hypothetical protein WR25_04659 [Diploscapter pachys]|uniref:Uncharacterized protein n=1 Tax=Diploscapter pachys TaxID=2018661 RepID=A0A2A2KHS5_9BILA|nr:hypothetical protein WR25_04659 [Diploscapter pachys]